MIIGERRHVHEAVGLRGVELNHEAMWLNFGDRGLEGAFVGAIDFAFEEFEDLDLHRVAFGFGAIAFGDGDVLAGARQLADAG